MLHACSTPNLNVPYFQLILVVKEIFAKTPVYWQIGISPSFYFKIAPITLGPNKEIKKYKIATRAPLVRNIRAPLVVTGGSLHRVYCTS